MWKTCVSKNGYIIRKETLDHSDYRKARLHLVANPLTNEQYYTPNNQFRVYKDTKEYLYVPQNYGIKTFGKPDKQTNVYQGKMIKEKRAVFKGELKDNQIEPYEAIMKAVDEKGGGIVCLETGYGKTFISIKVITSVKRTTLVVVNKISLLEQWKSELATFAPELRVGQIQGQNLDIEDKDVIIGMLQSLTKCDYPEALFNDFGMVIFDEAHNIPSRKFSEVLFKVSCPVMIGLSATPKRADGLEKVLQWHIGDTIPISKTTKEERVPEIKVLKLKSEEYKEVRVYNKMTRQDQLNFTGMLTELIQMEKRNQFIVETIKEVMSDGGTNEKRKVLVLTERRGHAQELKRLLDKSQVNFTYALFLGGMKIDYLNESRQQDVIIATIAAFAEGVSEKDLNTLILVSPKKFVSENTNTGGKRDNGKMEQIVGRIFRKEHTKETPALIIDLADQFSVFKSHSMQRCKFYRGHFKNVKIQYTIIDLDKRGQDSESDQDDNNENENVEMYSDY